MKNQQGEKTNIQSVIETLLDGEPLTSRQICNKILEMEGKDIKVQDVASMLSRISDAKKCTLGHFIKRSKKGNKFTYQMVKEAQDLSGYKAYNLTLKTGQDRYTVEHAIEEFPEMAKYITKPAKTARRGGKRKTTARAKKAKAAAPAASAPAAPAMKAPAGEGVNISGLAAFIQKLLEGGGVPVNVNVSVKFQ